MTIGDKHSWSLLRASAVIGLLALTAFAALSQGGLLVPKFRSSGSGRGGSSVSTLISNTMENVSARSWTVTGVHLTAQESGRTWPDVHILRLGFQRQDLPPSVNFPGPMVRRMTVSPGQFFEVSLLEKQSNCPSPQAVTTEGEAVRLANSRQNHAHILPAAFNVATPLGTRSIAMTLTVNCGL